MRRILALVAFFATGNTTALAGVVFESTPPPSTIVYVNGSTGSDANPCSQASPCATVAGAATYIRTHALNVAQKNDLIVSVAAGSYWLTSTLALTDADSGSGWSVRYRCAGVATCKLLGGAQLNTAACTTYSGSIKKCPLVGQIGTLWENGTRSREARTRAYAFSATYPAGQEAYAAHAATGVDTSQTVLQYNAADLTSPNLWDLTSARLAVWSGGQTTLGGTSSRSWFEDIIPIQSVNVGSTQITLAHPTIYAIFASTVGSRWYALGDLSFVAAAGDWYDDATNGFLYYFPVASPITSQTIVYPTLTNTVSLIGTDAAHPVANVSFEGFDIEFSTSPHNFQVTDHANQHHGLVYLENTRNVEFIRCELHNSGIHGIVAVGANTFHVDRSSIHDIALDGIHIDNDPNEVGDRGNVSVGHLIENTKIHDTAQIRGDGNGVYSLNVGRSTYRHLEIYNTGRTGWQLVGYAADGSKNYATGNQFLNSYVHDVSNASGDDSAVYVGQTNNQANTIDQIRVINSQAEPTMSDIAPTCMFTDDNGGTQAISNMYCTNVQNASHYRDNAAGHPSTQTNCDWVGGFNSALIDPTNGVLPTNPF